ncbi:GntR family transcriptional regulator [Mumia sp. ZJ1417]|uniref:GntR family transcriptional regulator n=2 Tax=Mumia TaxID=1546255 RepID=UPI00141DFCDC|nr:MULTISPECIES: GntR family transcriptional regulator [unclassified Mumia]QMW66488.1 GntR family transcriptional regulator [Mumia sp. ZJ1417]
MGGQDGLAADPLPVRALVAGLSDPSARGIADHVARLIEQGRLPDGTRLPTVRAVAAALHVGATTVATAWTLLRHHRLIRSDGRNGTYVRNLGASVSPGPAPAAANEDAGVARLDLVAPSYDVDLVPDPAPHLAAAAQTLAWHGAESAEVDEALAQDVHASWPFVPEALAVARGFSDALAQIVTLVVAPGDRVLVESACSPETVAVLAAHRAQIVRVPCDAAGMIPEEVERAMAVRPSLVVMQPRMADPLAHVVTEQRAYALASVLVDRDVLVVEEDSAAALATSPAASLGGWLPGQTVLVRDYQRSHGPRIRMALLAGSAPVVDRLRARQDVTGSFPSLLAQRTLSLMLRDPGVAETVARARWRYAHRWHALGRALRRHGVAVPGVEGLAVWVRVHDAADTVRRLGAAGIRVGIGTDVAAGEEGRRHVRIATSGLRFEQSAVAWLLATERTAAAG